jgi:glycosyltransferase involved in cell wall biosynthesis
MAISAYRTTHTRPIPLRARSLGGLDGRRSIGFVSTFPPTRCGLATFTASLARILARTNRIGVVACVDEPAESRIPRELVVAEWVRGSDRSLNAAVAALDGFDTVIVQHEFGLFGGTDGEDILELVDRLEAPIIVVLHTVLAEPSTNQRRIIEALAARAEHVVVQSEVARDWLLAAHALDPSRVAVIQHGASANLEPQTVQHDPARRPIVLTWGLLGPGKGIEFAIEALAELRDLEPAPRYVVLGQTHPNIVRHSGEAYRESLQRLAVERRVEHVVEFDARYRDTAGILAQVREADVILLPYLSRDQVVSGVLVEAIASAKPVVSTAFPHAVELLGRGSGIVVPHENPGAIASALRTLLTDRVAAARAAAVARSQARSLTWEHVGGLYAELARGVRSPAALAAS